MPALLGAMCRTFNSRMCTPAFQRDLTVMFYKGQVNIAYIAQLLQPNSPLWQTSALTFDAIFREELCRSPAPGERAIYLSELEKVLMLHSTWQDQRRIFRTSEEGRWCRYRRSVESHALLLSGTRLPGGVSEGCTVPIVERKKEGWQGGEGGLGDGIVRYPMQPIIAHYPRANCQPILSFIQLAVETKGAELNGSKHLQRVLSSRNGLSYTRTLRKVQEAYCRLLHMPAPEHHLNEHLSHVLSWRRSIGTHTQM
jgi:hypothetical protein